jgi:hypothetical protein
MIPFILAAVGGYLIGDSMKDSQTFANGGEVEYKVEYEVFIDDADDPYTDNRTKTFKDLDKAIEFGKRVYASVVYEIIKDGEVVEYGYVDITNKRLSKFANGGMAGELSSNLIDFYNVAKKSNSVKNLQILDKDEFKFISESDDNCRVYIRYDKDSDTIVMLQHRKYSTDYSEDDDITLQQFKKYLKK